MLVQILKSFPYAAEGIRSTMLTAGDEVDIRDDFVEGLEAAGFIDTGGRKPGSDHKDHPLFAELRSAEDAIHRADQRIVGLEGDVAERDQRITVLEGQLADETKGNDALTAAQADLTAAREKIAELEAKVAAAATTPPAVPTQDPAVPPPAPVAKPAAKKASGKS